MKRREFVRRLPVVTTGLLVGASSLSFSACGGAAYIVPTVRPSGLSFPASLLDGQGEIFLQTPSMERPLFLHLGEDGPVALLLSCTHRGCQPEPVGTRLICPCHGSEFSKLGEVLQGPAEEPLTRYDVSRDGDDFVVHVEGGAR